MRPNTTFKRFLCFSEFPLLNSSTQMRPTSTLKRILYLSVIFVYSNAPKYNFQAVPVLL